MTEPYLAMITPLTGNHPSHPIAPGGSLIHPSHPIAPGGSPPLPTHPIVPPPAGLPGDWTLVYVPAQGWMWASTLIPAGGGHPDHSLPMPPSGTLPVHPGNHPDHTLPPGANRPDNTLPPTATPKKP